MAVTIDRIPQSLRGEGARLHARTAVDRALLACSAAYALVYAAVNDVIAASLYDGYSRMSQAVSELSAVGAPTRAFLTATVPLCMALLTAFGIGVWRSAGGSRALRVAAAVIVAHAASAPLWLLAPMSRREVIAAGGGGLNDTLHLAMTALTIVLIVSYVGFGAAAFGWRFRIYSMLAVLAMLAAGTWTGVESAKLPSGEPTPWMGFAERVSIVVWLAWLIAFAVAVLRRSRMAVAPSLQNRGP
jgi:hypothetical protein